jgi:carboxymethylenebutenolidase
MEQRFVDLYDEYIHAFIDRRSFLERLTVMAGGASAAAAILPLIENDMAQAITILETDPRIECGVVPIPGGPANLTGYQVTPTYIGKKKPAKMPALVLVGENRSTNPNIKDICRRWGTEGFLVLGVDYLSPVGGAPVDQELAGQMTFKIPRQDIIDWYQVASNHLKSRPDVGKIGIIGWCWGGDIVNAMMVEDRNLACGVFWYGNHPDLTKVHQITGPLLGHYAGKDEPILLKMPAFEEALTKAGKQHTFYIYPGTHHGFFNDTNSTRWDPVAGQLAWDRSLAFLKKYLDYPT